MTDPHVICPECLQYGDDHGQSDCQCPCREFAAGDGGEVVTLSGDAEHVYVVDAKGRIISTHGDLDSAKAAMRCACRGTRRLSRAVIDGGEGFVTCPWCPPTSSESSDG